MCQNVTSNSICVKTCILSNIYMSECDTQFNMCWSMTPDPITTITIIINVLHICTINYRFIQYVFKHNTQSNSHIVIITTMNVLNTYTIKYQVHCMQLIKINLLSRFILSFLIHIYADNTNMQLRGKYITNRT